MREAKLRERRAEKAAKKEARKHAAAESPPEQDDAMIAPDVESVIEDPLESAPGQG